jgi:hypothetical protein
LASGVRRIAGHPYRESQPTFTGDVVDRVAVGGDFPDHHHANRSGRPGNRRLPDSAQRIIKGLRHAMVVGGRLTLMASGMISHIGIPGNRPWLRL